MNFKSDYYINAARAIDVNPNWHTNEFFYENPLNDLRTFLNRNTKVAHLHHACPHTC